MAKAVLSLALLALLSVSNAERTLLAHKPGGGALHAVALTSTASIGFVYLTNGNGTWTAYSANSAFVAAQGYSGWNNVTIDVNNPSGVQSVYFPSMSLGLAVGLNMFNPTATSPTGSTGSGSPYPTILSTVDMGLTWQAVTGFGGNPAFYNASSGVGVAPDLYSVYCVSKALCFAAGGYSAPVLAVPTTYGAAYTLSGYGSTYSGAASATAAAYNSAPFAGLSSTVGALPTAGSIYTSTNGGTFWKVLPVPANQGGLYSISADSSGKHVYAVGGTPVPFTTSNFQNYALNTTMSAGTILYSGNYGASFAAQTAPVISNYNYELYSVAVLRGTLAFACGGNPAATVANSSAFLATSGIIIGTANGGFSWNMQPINTFTNFNTTSASIPMLNSIAFARNSTSGYYNGWAVGEKGAILQTTVKIATPKGIAATYYQTTWNVAPQAANLLQTSTPNANWIVWDNDKVGYIFGDQVILSTHNSGMTWAIETPAAVSLNQAAVYAGAHVPTTY